MSALQKFKLGRKAVVTDSRTLRFSLYSAELPTPPESIMWNKGVAEFGMMLNDTLGDCTIACVGHATQIFTMNTAEEITLPDADIEQKYQAWCGYVPGDPSTDQGGIILNVLKAWRKHNIGGHQIRSFAAVDIRNSTELKSAIALFGGLDIGFNVPAYIMDGEEPALTWEINSQADNSIEGGHCVFVMGYDADWLYVISWGQVYRMSWAFWAEFVDEAWAILSLDFMNKNGVSASGFNQAQMDADQQAIAA